MTVKPLRLACARSGQAGRWFAVGLALAASMPLDGATGRSSEIAVKDRANANASLAAHGQFAALVWSASAKDATDIFAATSRDGGSAFGVPVRVNRTSGEASANGEQPPRVALVPRAGGDPSIVVVWTAKSATGTRLWTARSDDGGKSFSQPTAVPGSEAGGNRGWESIATDSEGRIVALWLDHREAAAGKSGAAMSHSEHMHEATAAQQKDGVARAQLSKLFFSRLDTPDSARPLTGGVCYCCKTTIAAGGNGAVYAAWRHVYPGNVRDIAFMMSADGGRTFTAPLRVSEDQWVLDGCPENGPTMAVDDQRRIHLVWPTLLPAAAPDKEPALALFYATSRDGRQFTKRQQLPTEGVPRHPQIAVGSQGEIRVVWDEQLSGTRRVALARAAAAGDALPTFTRQDIGGDARAVYPAIATSGSDTIVAWTSGSAQSSACSPASLKPRIRPRPIGPGRATRISSSATTTSSAFSPTFPPGNRRIGSWAPASGRWARER
jgi:hypothetical protein